MLLNPLYRQEEKGLLLYFILYNTQTLFGPFLLAPAGEVMSPECQTRHNATGYLQSWVSGPKICRHYGL